MWMIVMRDEECRTRIRDGGERSIRFQDMGSGSVSQRRNVALC